MSLISNVYIVGQGNWEGFDIERVFLNKGEANQCADFLNARIGAKLYTVEEWKLSDGGEFHQYFCFCISDKGGLIDSQESTGYDFFTPEECAKSRVEPRGKYHCYVRVYTNNREEALDCARALARNYFDGEH